METLKPRLADYNQDLSHAQHPSDLISSRFQVGPSTSYLQLISFSMLQRVAVRNLFGYTSQSFDSKQTKMKATFDVLTATASDLQKKLAIGDIRSVEIVELYLAQIEKHNDYLRAVLELSPRAKEFAEELDNERKLGKLRGPLHGIPILLKVAGRYKIAIPEAYLKRIISLSALILA